MASQRLEGAAEEGELVAEAMPFLIGEVARVTTTRSGNRGAVRGHPGRPAVAG